MTKIFSILFIIIVACLAPLSVAAQSNQNVTVKLTIDTLIANDLQEDGLINSNNVDEVYVEYTLEEVANGRGTGNKAVGYWGLGYLRLNSRVTDFEPIFLEIASTSSVRVEVRIIESDEDRETWSTLWSGACILTGLPVACAGDLAFSSKNVEFTRSILPQTYTARQLQVGMSETLLFTWTNFINWAEYELNYSVSLEESNPNNEVQATAAPSIPNATHETMVTLPGDFGSEVGCPADTASLGGDWEPSCTAVQMRKLNNSSTYVFTTQAIPAGNWEVKVAVGGSWDTNYGVDGIPGGDNILFEVPAENMEVTFMWDAETGELAIEVGEPAGSAEPELWVTLPGNFGNELGCTGNLGGDWEPSCPYIQMYDWNNSGHYFFATQAIPAGDWEVKVAVGGSWDTNYGVDGTPGGDNILFEVPEDNMEVVFVWNVQTNELVIEVGSHTKSTETELFVTLPGDFGGELGCTGNFGGDWEPNCLATHMHDIDGTGMYVYETSLIPAGNWEVKVAVDGTWDVNYGVDGISGGDNIGFEVSESDSFIVFIWDAKTHILTIQSR